MKNNFFYRIGSVAPVAAFCSLEYADLGKPVFWDILRPGWIKNNDTTIRQSNAKSRKTILTLTLFKYNIQMSDKEVAILGRSLK